MEAVGNAVSSLIWFLVFIAIVLAGIALFSYNNLQKLSQSIQESSSNVQVAISRKLSLINQLIDIVKNYQEGEQFTYLKISEDSSAGGLTSAYQQSGALLSSVQAFANRFPNLKANEQYTMLSMNIQQTENNIQNCRLIYNAAVKTYNTASLSIPTVFVSRALGFSKAPYLEFDTAGLKDVTALREFKTDDGERLHQMLSSAGTSIGGASRVIAAQATQKGKMLYELAKEKSGGEKPVSVGVVRQYFYMTPGGVPQGPTRLSDIQALMASGTLDETARVAEAGTSDWIAVNDVLPAGAQAPTDASQSVP